MSSTSHPVAEYCLADHKRVNPKWFFAAGRTLLARLYLFAILAAVDSLICASVTHVKMLIAPLAATGIVAFAVFLALGHSTFKKNRQEFRFAFGPYIGHLACLIIVLGFYFAQIHFLLLPWLFASVSVASGVIMLCSMTLLAVACIPGHTWIAILHETGMLWVYALAAGVISALSRPLFQLLWINTWILPGRSLQELTFHAIRFFLPLFVSNVVVDTTNFIVGSSRFSVIVAPECSGLEGIGLVLVFTCAWLWFFRKESRFPQALLLIPCAVICVWFLNILRICGLIFIGNLGATDVAMAGFHSQAGWIAFTAVSFAFSMATRRMTWIRKTDAPAPTVVVGAGPSLKTLHEAEKGSAESLQTRAYLVPFLLVVIMSVVANASGDVEWLYPASFAAAGLALWHYRKSYSDLRWRINWSTFAAAFGLFALRLILDIRMKGQSSFSGLDSAINEFPFMTRVAWLISSIAAVVIVIPFAEELAFRGFLARRVVSRHFESVRFVDLTLLAIVGSTVIYGVAQEENWKFGVLAGLTYAALIKRSGRLRDAVVAHATTNLLFTVWVVMRGGWGPW